eukprot:TRINITY_DN8756_c0_g1_i1.p1 TRINITY_DN8756_c0_g1~~TRINITY_DN8756_c0_g1_i1.p1  ORF type:complete len:417 (+),score=96.77 TRINITY_DN8756_c0_g1_i1:33-1283(+)
MFARATKLITSVSSRNFSTGRGRYLEFLQKELKSIESAGTFKRERIITSQQCDSITVAGRDTPVVNFCANNYLGLANNKQLMEAAKKMIDYRGLGLSSVRFICGTQDIHRTLEKRIADFHGTDDTILFGSAFDANGGVFEALFSEQDAVISDELNHASIIDGIRLCKAQRYRYKHMKMEDLEAYLKKTQNLRFRLIVTDGVFSMDGHIAPLQQICDLADKYDAMVFVDDSHSTGFFGKTGRGTDEYCGVQGRVDIINSTLGKALGGTSGGYCTSSKPIIDILRQRARPYLFSNTLAPSNVGACIAAFDLIANNTSLRDKLEANTWRFRKGMEANGFDLGGSKDHPIVPIMLGDARLAGQFADEMLKKGIYVIGFSYPVVPKGLARIRVQISAAHSFEEIDHAVESFAAVRKQLIKQ